MKRGSVNQDTHPDLLSSTEAGKRDSVFGQLHAFEM
jgi:hypothetical protein